MANALYNKYKETMMNPGSLPAPINLLTDTIRVALCTAGYSPTMATSTDQFFSAVGANTVGTPQPIGSPSITSSGTSGTGVTAFSGNNVTFNGVSGAQVTSLVIYKDTLNPSTSPLICRDDTASSGLPVTPNGGNITITWDTGASKIFAL